MTIKHVALILAAWGILAGGMIAGYQIGRRAIPSPSDPFKIGWSRGYQSGLDAGEEKTLYYVNHTKAWKQGWDACEEQF